MWDALTSVLVDYPDTVSLRLASSEPFSIGLGYHALCRRPTIAWTSPPSMEGALALEDEFFCVAIEGSPPIWDGCAQEARSGEWVVPPLWCPRDGDPHPSLLHDDKISLEFCL